MGKGKHRKNRDDNATQSNKQQQQQRKGEVETTSEISPSNEPLEKSIRSGRRSLYQFCVEERKGILYVLRCAFLGGLFGFGIGSGLLTGEVNKPPNAWRVGWGVRIRSSTPYRVFTMQNKPWEPLYQLVIGSRRHFSFLNPAEVYDNPRSVPVETTDPDILRSEPSHPIVYAVLREAIVREQGGYVHPDLGFLEPAPCGAARGLGMLRDNFHQCQKKCIPGIAHEKLIAKLSNSSVAGETKYFQEEVLIKVPLGFQMTRTVALDTLLPLVPAEVQRKANLHELDDGALLTLLLAHENGVGRYSRWLPYIASLPLEPSCGYSKELRPYLLDSINAMQEELKLDVNGWPGELLKATQYADRIATNLARDYGKHIENPEDWSAEQNIEWALCQVASRGIAGSQKHGSLRMIPLIDMINHDANAGGFVELTGKERLKNGDFLDALTEEDSGTFVIRSLRYGRRKALRAGQELLANYNVPHYTPLDWFVSSGFVPPERWQKWEKIDSALPRIRRDGPFGNSKSGGSSAMPPMTSKSNSIYQNSEL